MTDSTGPITPARCAEFAARLRDAVTVLNGFGVKVHNASRLAAGARQLDRTALAGRFPSAVAERRALLFGLRDATEWHMIADALGPPIEGELLNDLRRAVKGSLVPRVGESLTPLQLQAQLFFGALLVQDGHPLGAPTKQGHPDFVVHDGSLAHGIEVKAPESERGLRNAVDGADDQLIRLSGGGMLVLDVSLLVQQALGCAEAPDGTDSWLQERVREIFNPLKETVCQAVRQRGSWKRGRGITASCLLTRVQHWLGDTPGSAMALAWRRYYQTHGSLAFWRATMLGDRVGAALQRLVPGLQIAWEK